MSDRRPGPPLFELLGSKKQDTKGLGGTSDPDVGSKPTVQVELQAQDDSASNEQDRPNGSLETQSAVVSHSERSAALGASAVHDAERVVKLSMPRVYMIIAIMLTTMVGVWATAFHFGVNAGKAEMEPLLQGSSSVVPVTRGSDPDLGASGVTDPAGSDGDGARSEPVQIPSSPPEDAGAAPRARVLTAQGVIPDPRIVGSNYLQMGALDSDQAQDAISFFQANGVALIGVPLDSGGQAGNNPSRYMLFSIGLQVPSERYRSMGDDRRRHRSLVASIGTRWQRERRGGSDFAESKTLWKKYD